MEQNEISANMEAVKKALALAKPYGLEIEVATYALMMIRLDDDEELSIEEALNAALRDWDIIPKW